MIWPFNKKQAISLDGNNQGIVVNGSINGNIIQGSTGRHQLTQLHIPWDTQPDPALIPSMLNWKSRIPRQLIGRDTEMEEMLRWAQTDFPLKMRFIYAQGGMGKTRFAFELAEKLKQQGWKAGQMLQPDAKVCYEVGKQGLLLQIIDYPEEQSNALATLVKQLARMEMPKAIKLRILLLSRRDTLVELPYRYDPLYALAALNHSNEQTEYSWELFQSAWQTMQRHQQKENTSEAKLPLTQSQFKQWLEQTPVHYRPLFILAFALHLLNHPDQYRLAGAEIIRQLVKRESRRLGEEAKSKGMDADSVMLLKALAGITGGINKTVLENLQATEDTGVALPTLRKLSQSSFWEEESQSIPPLQPDLLAAQLLQNELDKDYLQTSQWLYQSLIADDENRQREAIDRLGRLIFDYHHTLKNQQQESPREKTDLITALVQTIEANQERCQRLKTIVYMKNLTQPLLPLAIAVSKQMVETCEDKEVQARLLNNLSVRLAESGEREQGLEAIRRAVAIYEQLAEQNFAAYASDLADSLNNLSNRLAEAGDCMQGLEAIHRAVSIDEQLAEQNFSAYAPDLTDSLNNLSNRLAEAGEREQGLEAIHRAVEIHEQLAEKKLAAYAPGQAKILSNLSVHLAESGDCVQGLEAIRRAVVVYEQLFEQNYAAYAPDLANSLRVLANCLEKAGELRKALSNSERAVELIKPFANPGTLYADWQQEMQSQLARLKSNSSTKD